MATSVLLNFSPNALSSDGETETISIPPEQLLQLLLGGGGPPGMGGKENEEEESDDEGRPHKRARHEKEEEEETEDFSKHVHDYSQEGDFFSPVYIGKELENRDIASFKSYFATLSLPSYKFPKESPILSLLLLGEKGSGKTTFARSLALQLRAKVYLFEASDLVYGKNRLDQRRIENLLSEIETLREEGCPVILTIKGIKSSFPLKRLEQQIKDYELENFLSLVLTSHPEENDDEDDETIEELKESFTQADWFMTYKVETPNITGQDKTSLARQLSSTHGLFQQADYSTWEEINSSIKDLNGHGIEAVMIKTLLLQGQGSKDSSESLQIFKQAASLYKESIEKKEKKSKKKDPDAPPDFMYM